MDTMKFAITGASGYVGTKVAQYLRSKGNLVDELGRHPSKNIRSSENFKEFVLGKSISTNSFKGVDVLIHAAYDFKASKWDDIYKINVQGSEKLFSSAKKAGVKKIIFISTLSAFDGCKTKYGKSKLGIEQIAKKYNSIILRPGLMYGKNPKGMVGNLSKLVSMSKVLPLVGNGNQELFLCHHDDLAKLILFLSKSKTNPPFPIVAASSKKFTYKKILEMLSKSKGKKVFFVPMPYWVLFLPLKMVEIILPKLGLRADSLKSLVNLNNNIDFNSTSKFLGKNVKFRKFETKLI